MHHHGDQLDAVALGRGRQTVPRGGGIAGLEAGCAVIEAHQLVGIGKAEFAAAHRIHPDCCVLFDFLVLQQLA